jgi:hypothetical protein
LYFGSDVDQLVLASPHCRYRVRPQVVLPQRQQLNRLLHFGVQALFSGPVRQGAAGVLAIRPENARQQRPGMLATEPARAACTAALTHYKAFHL